MYSIYDCKPPWGPVIPAVRQIFPRYYGYASSLTDKQLTRLCRGKRKAETVFTAMDKAEPKVNTNTVWYRWRFLTRGGYTAWVYEDSHQTKINRKEVRSRMEDLCHARACEYGQASIRWEVTALPLAVLQQRIKIIQGDIAGEQLILARLEDALYAFQFGNQKK